MRCEQIMKYDITCASPEDPVMLAARRMREHNIGFLPVCDESMRVLGTVTDRDLAIRVVSEARPASTPVSEVMTREVVACSPKDDLREAERKMGRAQKSRIMCIDDAGKLCGIISLSDIAQFETKTRASDTLREVSAREARV